MSSQFLLSPRRFNIQRELDGNHFDWRTGRKHVKQLEPNIYETLLQSTRIISMSCLAEISTENAKQERGSVGGSDFLLAYY